MAVCGILVLTAAGTARAQALDATFNPGANFEVDALAVQADGKIVVGGGFTMLGGGGTGTTPRNGLGRLNADGSLDASFNPGVSGSNQSVLAFAVQPDGKILVGGQFTTLGGSARANIGRLNADGSLDTTFNPGIPGNVFTLALQPNGQILVGGAFTAVGGITCHSLCRLNADGSVDATFNPNVQSSPGFAGQVIALAVQADGKILIGGSFNWIGATLTSRLSIARLNQDGSVDSAFNPGANAGVYALAVQADGRIVVGGGFTALGGAGTTPSRSLGRLNADGTLDSSFTLFTSTSGTVADLAVQVDGKILFGGVGFGLQGIGRVNPNGSKDPSFGVSLNPFSEEALAITLQPDGKILVGGNFETFGCCTLSHIERLLNTTPPVDFNEDGSGDAFLQNAAGNWAIEGSGAGPAFGFTTAGSGTWAPGWSVTPAHFSGSGLTDLFLFNNSTGQWFRMLNNGSGDFTVQSTAAWGTNWQRYVVDLNGDGISDVFLWDPTLGQWFECLSDGSGNFTYTQGFWEPGLEVYPMHFTTSGRQDFFLFNRSTGQWFWAEGAPGGGFTYPQSAFWSPGWTFYPGDFNGDGLTDLLLVNPSTGFWFVAMTGAGGFTYTSGFFAPGFNIYPMDLAGAGRTDLFLDNPTTGQWFEMISNGAGGFTNVGGAAWTLGWQLYPTNFTGGGAQDLLLYNPTTGVWFQAINQYPDGSPAVFSYVGGVWSPGLSIIATWPFFGGS